MEPTLFESAARWVFMVQIGLYAVLSGVIFSLCIAGLIWAPFGALIAGSMARRRGRSWLVSSFSSTLMSVCMLFPWVFALRAEFGHPPGPRMIKVAYGFVYSVWGIGPILTLFTVLAILIGLASLYVAHAEPYYELMSEGSTMWLLWVMFASAFALSVMCLWTWYWSLRNLRSELNALRQPHRADSTTAYLYRFGEFEIVTLLPIVCLACWFIVLPFVYFVLLGLAFGIATVES